MLQTERACLFTIEKSQMAICDPDTLEIIPEGIDSLVNWIKSTVRSVYLETWGCPSPCMNTKWNTPEEAADMLHMLAMWDWLYDDQDIHLLNMLISQVMVNVVIKGVSVAWVPNSNNSCRDLSDLLSRLPFRVLIKTLG